MTFNEQVTGITDEIKLTAPSRWHIVYYLKWKFFIKPRMIKELAKAQAPIIDDINKSSVLGKRIK